ncbi:MAG: GNAT family N-acetyltransferase [Paludibacteraceae bacterium]|nr:GNAT family N-acetyltransferase [Paludibacteraceae bacterium]
MIQIRVTKDFERQFKRLYKKYRSLPEDLTILSNQLVEAPTSGIDLGDGIRKIRMSVRSKGSTDYQRQNLGSDLMDKLKMLLKNEVSHSAFRYITVDAYISAIPFYLKNGFVELTKKEEDEHTKLMYFDIMELE